MSDTTETVNETPEFHIDVIEPIENVLPVVEKVIDQETGKVFNVRSDLFFLDDENQLTRRALYGGCGVEFKNPVPVKSDSGKLIGSAVLDIQGSVIMADIFIDYATPERLNLETRSIPVYPVLDAYSEVTSEGHKTRATKLVIEGIILTPSPTNDDRVNPL